MSHKVFFGAAYQGGKCQSIEWPKCPNIGAKTPKGCFEGKVSPEVKSGDLNEPLEVSDVCNFRPAKTPEYFLEKPKKPVHSKDGLDFKLAIG